MNSSDYDEVETRVLESLAGGSYACRSLEKLTGGSSNYVYRGILFEPLQDGSRTIVIKHSEAYVASMPKLKLSVERCTFEHIMLSALEANMSPLSHTYITVQTPKCYRFINSTHTQLYSDLQSSTELKTYLLTQTLNKSQCSRLGFALGTWTKQFHQWGASPEQASLLEKMRGQKAMKDLKYAINYKKLLVKVNLFPHILQEHANIFEAVVKDAEETFNRDDGRLIHGDFWTGNVLLQNTPLPNEETAGSTTIFIVDWEFSHLSSVAYDLGQMFAELYQVKHFKNIDAGVWIMSAFMKGYGRLNDDQAFKVAIHVGTHLVCWGSSVPDWGSQEQVEKVVQVGRDYIVHAWERDTLYFHDTPLSCLFG